MAKKTDKPANKQTMAEISQERKDSGGHKDKLRVGWTPEVDKALNKDKAPSIILDKADGLSAGVRPVQMVNSEADVLAEKDAKEYNAKVSEIDPLYGNLKPIRKILVRCFHKEPQRTEGGLILPVDEMEVKVPTQTGQGIIGVVKSPWAFSKRAVVVAVPDYSKPELAKLRVGNVIQLNTGVLKAVKGSKDMSFDLPNSFTHHTWGKVTPPESKKSPHYGYFLVPEHEIDMIIE